jgi:hypothetical protein
MRNLYRGLSIDASYQVSVHLAEGFQRRFKCEKLMDDRQRTLFLVMEVVLLYWICRWTWLNYELNLCTGTWKAKNNCTLWRMDIVIVSVHDFLWTQLHVLWNHTTEFEITFPFQIILNMLVLISNTVNKHLQKVVKQSKFAKNNIDIRQNRNVFIEMQRIPNEN